MSADRVEIGNCIIAGMAEGGGVLNQMSEIVTRLELAGWVIVPREPMPEMLTAGFLADEGCEMPGRVYRAMIDAAHPPSDVGSGKQP